MRLFLAAFCLTAVLTASTAFAESDEPLTGGSTVPGHARFETTPAEEFIAARARTEALHRDAIIRHYDWIGYNFGRPNVHADSLFNATAPVRIRRIYSYPNYWIDSRGYGY